jgi:hypothetical protein
MKGTAVAQWLRRCATNRKIAGSIPDGFRWNFSLTQSFRSHYGPGVDSGSNRNEYQDYFLGVKSGRCVRLTTYHHPVPLSRNLGTLTSWNPLGTSGPVKGLIYLYACNKFYFIMCFSWLMDCTSVCPRHQCQDQSSAPEWTTICTIQLIVTKRNIRQLPHFAMVSTPAILPHYTYNR